MTSSRHLHRVHEAGVVRSCPHPEEIESWLEDVGPVLAALHRRTGPPSSGLRRWLAEQVRLATEADDSVDHLVAAAEEADAAPAAVDDLRWLHTRVCAVTESLRRIRDQGAAAA
jgi:hypothetical protein